MFETEPAPDEKPAKPLTQKQLAARLKAKKVNTVAVLMCAMLCWEWFQRYFRQMLRHHGCLPAMQPDTSV
jgi:hypothetical protein